MAYFQTSACAALVLRRALTQIPPCAVNAFSQPIPGPPPGSPPVGYYQPPHAYNYGSIGYASGGLPPLSTQAYYAQQSEMAVHVERDASPGPTRARPVSGKMLKDQARASKGKHSADPGCHCVKCRKIRREQAARLRKERNRGKWFAWLACA
jgi:hypothetical protein